MSSSALPPDAALLDEFAQEAREQLDALEQDLLTLQGGASSPELLKRMLRLAHTFKGNCAMVGFQTLVGLAHGAEDVLQLLFEGALSPSAPLVRTLLRTVDALRHGTVGAVGRGVLDSGLTKELARWGQKPGGASPQRRAAASDEDAPDTTVGASRSTVRISLPRLDEAVNLLSELSTAQAHFRSQLFKARGSMSAGALEAYDDVEQLFEQLQSQIIGLRMVPIGPLFRQTTRLVHDIGAELGKEVSLELEGEDVQLDAAVIERVRDPLTHLVRNALDHGLELPAERAAQRKAPTGRLVLRARYDGGNVAVEVEDDGRGLDRERILKRAAARLSREELEALADGQIDRLILEAGFTTTEKVTALSGRGVGMDVVNQSVKAMRGTLDIQSRPGQGVTFTLRVPLTLALIDGLSVSVGSHVCIIPRDAVIECMDLPEAERAERCPRGVVVFHDAPLPYLRLRELFGGAGGASARETLVVVRQGGQSAGLVVDALRGQTRSVVRSLGGLFCGARSVSGAAVESDGGISLVLDVARLVEDAGSQTRVK